ncbi:hypothetical protein [Streptomyces yunnanensis]|uniref:Lipoprotein n=1 Tax=Streptomyces yunnanensis TaxID=156453 RepID=A0A9X8N9R8_9ACTN|nr:hypothetical protein [Streptomyces yunnanensis]SHN34928.1 hypothetical protein SAMN05216268_1504 [Streptomyces yunnanensis]
MLCFGRRRSVPVSTAALAGLAAVGLVLAAGCAPDEGTRDAGVAPSVTAPDSASPLWPGRPPAPSHGGPAPSAVPVPQVTVPEGPEGSLRKVSPDRLLRADPAVPEVVKGSLGNCPGTRCRLRAPVYVDLTGDGKPELVLAFDDIGRTLMWVYTASGDSVRRVLDYAGQPQMTAATVGRDLVVDESGGGRKSTIRYRWNGRALAPVPVG